MLIYWIVLGIITPIFYFPLKKFFSFFVSIISCITSFILAALFPLILPWLGIKMTMGLYSILILVFSFVIYLFESKAPTCQADNALDLHAVELQTQDTMLAEPDTDINQEIISEISDVTLAEGTSVIEIPDIQETTIKKPILEQLDQYEPAIEESFIEEPVLEQLIPVEPVFVFGNTSSQEYILANESDLNTKSEVSQEPGVAQAKPEILTEVEDWTENDQVTEPAEIVFAVQAEPEVEVETVPYVSPFDATTLPISIELDAQQDKIYVRDLITNGMNNYRQGNYIQAGKEFYQAILKQPDTDLLYIAVSELSSVYQHMGFYYLAAELLRFFLPVLEKSLHPGVMVLTQKLAFIEHLYQLLLVTNLSRLPYSEVPEKLKIIAFNRTINY